MYTLLNSVCELVMIVTFKINNNISLILTIILAWVFYEQIVNVAQPSWLSLVENEGK